MRFAAAGTAVRLPGAVVATSIVLAGLALPGCAGSPQAEPETVLHVLMADDWASTAPVTDAVRSFEREHPNVRVRLRGMPFPQIPETIRASAASGEPVDVAQWHAFAVAAQGLAQPLDDLWAAHGLSPGAFVPGAVEDVAWGDGLYGLPLDTNALVLAVNTDHLAEAGVAPHEVRSFDTLLDVARRTTTGDRRGLAVSASSWATYGWIRANGGEIVEVDGDGEPTFTIDDPANVRALEFLAALVGEGLAAAPSQPDLTTDASILFQTGIASMLPTGTWDVVALGRDPPDWDYDVVPIPRGPDATRPATVIGGSSLFVPEGSTQRELAFEFMLHITREEYALRYAREHGRMPALRDTLDHSLFEDPTYVAAVRSLEHAGQMKLIAFPDAQEAFSNALTDIMTGRSDPATALAQAQEQAEAVYGDDP